MDHTDAVLDVDWSPTGRELVSASYDRTVRIFQQGKNRSRECYHIKRMQRVFSCAFSGDAQYLMCGSDEGNIRLWKTVAWAKTGVLNFRQRQSLQYSEALKKKFAHHNVRNTMKLTHLNVTLPLGCAPHRSPSSPAKDDLQGANEDADDDQQQKAKGTKLESAFEARSCRNQRNGRACCGRDYRINSLLNNLNLTLWTS